MKLWKFGLRNTVKLPALYSWTGSENLTKASWCTALRKSLLLWKVTLLYYSERSAKVDRYSDEHANYFVSLLEIPYLERCTAG